MIESEGRCGMLMRIGGDAGSVRFLKGEKRDVERLSYAFLIRVIRPPDISKSKRGLFLELSQSYLVFVSSTSHPHHLRYPNLHCVNPEKQKNATNNPSTPQTQKKAKTKGFPSSFFAIPQRIMHNAKNSPLVKLLQNPTRPLAPFHIRIHLQRALENWTEQPWCLGCG